MSADRIDTIVKVEVTRCDICGEILPEEVVADREQAGSVLGFHPMSPPATTEHKWMRFGWSGLKLRKAATDADAKNGTATRHDRDLRDRNYDFHGDCLLRLVEAAIELRTNPPEPVPVPKPTRDDLAKIVMHFIDPRRVASRAGAEIAIDALMDEYEISERA